MADSKQSSHPWSLAVHQSLKKKKNQQRNTGIGWVLSDSKHVSNWGHNRCWGMGSRDLGCTPSTHIYLFDAFSFSNRVP